LFGHLATDAAITQLNVNIRASQQSKLLW